MSRSDLSDVHPVADPQAKLLLKHGQVDGEAIGGGVKLTAHSLEEQVRLVTQQRVPVVPQVELWVLSSRVYLVNADELSVPGIPRTERFRVAAGTKNFENTFLIRDALLVEEAPGS